MKAIILAAGRGSRMKNLTDDKPKCLVEFRGRALIDWQLEALRGAGIVDIAIVTGYRYDQLAHRGLIEFHNPRWNETNMVGSLRCAISWLETTECIVTYSDIYYSAEAVKSLMNCPADIATTYDPDWLGLWEKRFGNPLLDAETFRINSSGELLEIGGTPESIDEIEGQYMGLMKFKPAGWGAVLAVLNDLVSSEQDRVDMTGIFQKVLEANNSPIIAVPYSGKWGEIDSESDLGVAEKGYL